MDFNENLLLREIQTTNVPSYVMHTIVCSKLCVPLMEPQKIVNRHARAKDHLNVRRRSVPQATRTFGVCSYNARSAVRCRSVHRQHQHHARWGWKRERVATRTHGRDVLYRFPPKGFTAAIITSKHLSLYNRISDRIFLSLPPINCL